MDTLEFIKNLAIKIIFLIFAYLSPIQAIFFAVWFLLFVDLLTGIWKSVKTGKRLTSNRLRSTVEKTFFYSLSIVVLWVVDKTFFNCSIHLAEIIGGYIALTEVISIFENIAEITGHDFYLKIQELIKETITNKLTTKK